MTTQSSPSNNTENENNNYMDENAPPPAMIPFSKVNKNNINIMKNTSPWKVKDETTLMVSFAPVSVMDVSVNSEIMEQQNNEQQPVDEATTQYHVLSTPEIHKRVEELGPIIDAGGGARPVHKAIVKAVQLEATSTTPPPFVAEKKVRKALREIKDRADIKQPDNESAAIVTTTTTHTNNDTNNLQDDENHQHSGLGNENISSIASSEDGECEMVCVSMEFDLSGIDGGLSASSSQNTSSVIATKTSPTTPTLAISESTAPLTTAQDVFTSLFLPSRKSDRNCGVEGCPIC
jgi:hypothetical protein